VQTRLKIKAYATADAIIGGVTGTLARPEQVVIGRYDSETGEFRMVARTVPIPDPSPSNSPASSPKPEPTTRGPSRSPGSGSARRAPRRTYASNRRSSPRSASTATQAGRWRHGSRLLRLRPDLGVDDILYDLDLEQSRGCAFCLSVPTNAWSTAAGDDALP
jgi:hypothetical protein